MSHTPKDSDDTTQLDLPPAFRKIEVMSEVENVKRVVMDTYGFEVTERYARDLLQFVQEVLHGRL